MCILLWVQQDAGARAQPASPASVSSGRNWRCAAPSGIHKFAICCADQHPCLLRPCLSSALSANMHSRWRQHPCQWLKTCFAGCGPRSPRKLELSNGPASRREISQHLCHAASTLYIIHLIMVKRQLPQPAGESVASGYAMYPDTVLLITAGALRAGPAGGSRPAGHLRHDAEARLPPRRHPALAAPPDAVRLRRRARGAARCISSRAVTNE